MHSSRRVRGGRFCTGVAESVTVGHVVSKPLGSPVGLDDVRDPIHRVKTGRVCEGMPRSKRSGVRPIGRWRTFGSGHAEETCRSRIFPSGRGEETCRSSDFPTSRIPQQTFVLVLDRASTVTTVDSDVSDRGKHRGSLKYAQGGRFCTRVAESEAVAFALESPNR